MSDPTVLYLIVRGSLNMSAGKTAAQVGHCVERILIHYFKAQIINAKFHGLPKDEEGRINATTDWMAQASTKIVLKADEKEWIALKQEFTGNCFVIKDNGLTEVAPGTETAMVIWPMAKSNATKAIRRLQCLR